MKLSNEPPRAIELSAHQRIDMTEWEHERDDGDLPAFVKHVREAMAHDLARQMMAKGLIEFTDSRKDFVGGMPGVVLSAHAIIGGTKLIAVETPLSWAIRSHLRRWWVRVRVFG